MRGTYFEDVVVDKTTVSPAITLTEAHVAMYLGVTRELPDGPAVPDVLPLCLTIGLGWRVADPPMIVLAFVGLDWQMVRPLRVGDTMRARSRILSKRAMRDVGYVVEERSIVDQHGEVVQQGRFTFLVAKRKEVSV